ELNLAHVKKVGRPADPIAGPAYACVQILAGAIGRAGSLDRDKIRDAIAATDMVTVIGPVKFRPDGTGIVNAVFLQWLNGKQELVWPRDSATAPLGVCAEGIARTFQLVRPFAGLSALDNVLVGRLYGRARGARHAAVGEAERLLALVGLEGKAHRLPAHLTLIDRKRLELARALATAPRLLLPDEFMAGLNPAETESAMALIRRIQDEGVTLLM